MITTRSPKVMASTWSWVTNTDVVGISACRRLISMRICARSFGVEVRQRLVEQEHLRIAHDAAAERDALLLSAGQLLRLALQQLVQAEHVGGAVDRRLDLGFRRLLVAQAKGEIVVDAQVLIERVVLEHHGDVAVARRQMVDDPARRS